MIIEAAEAFEIPLIAAGDFYSAPSAFLDSERSTSGQNAMDVLMESRRFDVNSHKMPSHNEMTYPSIVPAQAIDWILIPADWRSADYRVIPSHLSDHRPVIADLELPIGSRE